MSDEKPGFSKLLSLHIKRAFCTSVLKLTPLIVQSGRSCTTPSAALTQSVALHGALKQIVSICILYSEQGVEATALAHTEAAIIASEFVHSAAFVADEKAARDSSMDAIISRCTILKYMAFTEKHYANSISVLGVLKEASIVATSAKLAQSTFAGWQVMFVASQFSDANIGENATSQKGVTDICVFWL
ncbi:hypothetical protein CCR75_003065 [Bremia lactucae]|uniref:Uncharacterized protein n=1 Tax=Bremia lactucae TaxID=4779 RepID=A0A976IMH5_BRELC|nr:hypothetical protein CCR75_003065 [Bremia lactucae]